MGEWEVCPRCGRYRLPAAWYKRGYEWLGHADPCIGVTRRENYNHVVRSGMISSASE